MTMLHFTSFRSFLQQRKCWCVTSEHRTLWTKSKACDIICACHYYRVSTCLWSCSKASAPQVSCTLMASRDCALSATDSTTQLLSMSWLRLTQRLELKPWAEVMLTTKLASRGNGNLALNHSLWVRLWIEKNERSVSYKGRSILPVLFQRTCACPSSLLCSCLSGVCDRCKCTVRDTWKDCKKHLLAGGFLMGALCIFPPSSSLSFSLCFPAIYPTFQHSFAKAQSLVAVEREA